MNAGDAGVEIVRHARARRMKLSVDAATGQVRLVLPPRASARAGLAWAEQQRAWIERRRANLPQPRPFVPGAAIPLGDDTLTIEWDADRPRHVVREGDALRCGGPREGLATRVTAWLRREALRVLSAETAEFATRAGVGVAKVAVGDTRSRWGSCASSGTIRYSWRLILAPGFVRRATVAHEVAHRLHMNHGPDFRRLVELLDERSPAESRAWLRANGAALHWLGRES